MKEPETHNVDDWELDEPNHFISGPQIYNYQELDEDKLPEPQEEVINDCQSCE